MYQSFSVLSILPNYAEKTIVINTSFDIDPDSVNENSIQLFSKVHRTDENIDFNVDRRTITVMLKNDIIPNTDYIIRVSGIKTILGDELNSGVRRTITFKSMVREVPYIISPSNYEEVVDLKVTLKAILEDKDYEAIENKTYFIQIAEDVAFINIVLETSTVKPTINIKDLKAGQYFIRARVETIDDSNNKDFGKWSDIVSFVSIKEEVPENDNNDNNSNDNSEPEYIEDLELISKPINGETPESILLEFSGEIDPDFIDNIVVIRRDI